MKLWSYFLQNKIQVRHDINEKRIAVSDRERNKAAQSATTLLMQTALFSSAQHIACYLARTEEFDCTPMIQSIWAAQKNCYLPVLSSTHEHYLEFAAYHANDVLQLNKYRILEPDQTVRIAAEKIDLVLLPLLAFDLSGNRLGAGGGYYDRTFAFLKDKSIKSPVLMGLAYEFQLIHELPHDEWDVPLSGIVTEQQIRYFK
jgi:5-formyltetrahydrofolate cyclo-ligase